MPSVRLAPFILATALASPRLILYVYSGKVLYELMDLDASAKPAGVKWLEGGSALAGMLLAGGLGYYLMTQVNRILDQEEEERGLLLGEPEQHETLSPSPSPSPSTSPSPSPSPRRSRSGSGSGSGNVAPPRGHARLSASPPRFSVDLESGEQAGWGEDNPPRVPARPAHMPRPTSDALL